MATVRPRASVVALMNGATNEPIRPTTNIVANDETTPILIKPIQEYLIALVEGPQSELEYKQTSGTLE